LTITIKFQLIYIQLKSKVAPFSNSLFKKYRSPSINLEIYPLINEPYSILGKQENSL